MKVALVVCVTLLLCVGAVLVTKTAGHHTSCRTIPANLGTFPATPETTTCTTKKGLW
jgi:hypothetical protein